MVSFCVDEYRLTERYPQQSRVILSHTSFWKEAGKKTCKIAVAFFPRKKVTKEVFPESKPAILAGSVQWFMRFQHSSKKQ